MKSINEDGTLILEAIDKPVDGTTPHIGDNNHWYIGDTDTGVNARGMDGITPHIGDNEHWWIGNVDTGVVASVDIATDEEANEYLFGGDES